MRFNHRTFFNEYRKYFGSLNQDQVNGLTGLLNNYERYHGWWDNLDQIANSLSQVKHETAHSFQPCVEGYYLGDPHQPHYYQGNTQRVTRFQQHLRYYPHIGRGFLQLTWLENYKEIDRLTHKFFPELVTEYEQRTGQRFDLLAHPEQMFDADLSFAAMTVGMHRGTFRAGHTLDRYINSSRVDHYYAREIVNGDKRYVLKGSGMTVGEAIAKEAKAFGQILRTSLLETTPENVSEVIDSQRTDSPVATQLPPDSGQANPLNDQQQPVENPSAGQPASKFDNVMGSLESYGGKLERVDGTVSKVSSSSLFSYMSKMLMAAGAFGIGFIKDNWEWLVVGGLIVIVAVWFWNESKKRANERTITALKNGH